MATTLNDTTNYLSSLVNAGADAMTNLYYVQFIGGHIDTELSTALTVRNSDITFPTVSHPVDKKNFMTTSVDVPRAFINIEKRLSIRFRVDSNYKVYKYLLDQQAETSIPNLGFAATKTPDETFSSGAKGTENGFKVLVYGSSSEIYSQDQVIPEASGITPNYKKLYEFRYCWLSELTPLTYSYTNANPLTVEATIFFYDYDDPQSLLK